MVSFLSLFTPMIKIFVLVAMGFFLKKTEQFPQDFFDQLSKLLVRFFLPIYFFAKFAKTDLSLLKDAWLFPVSAAIIVLAAMAIAFASSILIPAKILPREERKAYIALSAFGNSGYLPITNLEILATIPLIMQSFGKDLPGIYIGAYLIGSSTLLWTAGYSLITNTRITSVKKLLTPTVKGILLGLLIPLTGIQPIILSNKLPFLSIIDTLGDMGATIMPLILICLGAMLAGISVNTTEAKRYTGIALAISGIRLIALPILFYASYFLFLKTTAISKPALWVLFLETHTPTATNLSVMAMGANQHRDITGITLFVAYIVYLFIFPISLSIFLGLVL
ncbi:AEC family transporter [Spirochaetia bacterium 38H-sp]|uniref:AEC family transporter n=1 Tax=Rarispira pelagica TaxID=3141764 RepID=A0ABU9UBK6_9SPIR